ncbi:hypothetical protein ASPZODRAFT_512952 [Penicilliopsis zonata CBS 506.65]|uniref:Zn(2)-C6 fungal-type domain-containing protein n=1 Tax=Penicilliopsis zonata CBS 506.65 TaxID=1073090 RepID=A0A1L9SF35_9EURO|nr:hypothetical protein ASPZODRAFT_512952 [Penicilliopsis zonata CBS 506.65]OJJ45707.1 hypothetical protein ASPZODRAFT_512952 [Penicilliopsis zonata CBS 506.65]
MGSLQLQPWIDQSSCSKLPYSDADACSQVSNMDNGTMLHLSGNDAERLSPKKMAIPRLAEGAEAAFSAPGRFHRRHVRRACESCRQRKTKCTGDKSGCRNCREAGIICCYTDGKREKSKRQLASLSAKVQAYEDVVRKLSNRFGMSDEQLMNIALTVEGHQDLTLQPEECISGSGDQAVSWNAVAESNLSRSSSTGSFDVVDHTEEDFNRDDLARATGYIGKSSEIAWLQQLCKELNGEFDGWPADASILGLPSPSLTPKAEIQNEAMVLASSNYYLDDLDIPRSAALDTNELPSRETASKLFNAFITSVHPSFPIIGISTFVSQFQVFFNQPSLKPGSKWLAILNLIFAIGAKFGEFINADWKEGDDDHVIYFSRARALSMDDQVFHHPDLQQLQVEGLTSFYLLACGHLNRSWKLCGSAVRGALALGLHLRNVGDCTSDTSKEIRYRVWWSLYTIEHLLSLMTGRPSCIINSACTTPLPVPFDETDFQKEEVSRLISSSSRGNSLESFSLRSNAALNGTLESDCEPPSASKDAEISKAEYLKTLAPCMSLYFVELAALTSIAKRMTSKLYSPEALQSPWAGVEFTIQSLMLDIDSWLLNLPGPYDFTSTQSSQCPAGQRMGLAFLFYSTKIGITRPCLCRLESVQQQGDQIYEFCNKTAAECVESACHMLTLFPDTTDASLLYKIAPWWCILHYLMQATTVLLLEISFKSQHVPEKSSMVSKAIKKAIEWLYTLSKSNIAAERAWKRSDGVLRRLAPGVEIDISDLPYSNDLATAAATAPTAVILPVTTSAEVSFDSVAPAADSIAAELDSIICSPMDPSDAALDVQLPYDLDRSETLDFLKPDKSALANAYDDLFPYDPATGQITGSFFPPTANVDLDLGCFWGDPIC